MSHIIAGKGEIGEAVGVIMNGEWHDPPKDIFVNKKNCGFLHICIPYLEDFEETVSVYQKKFNPSYTVIHSTVPVGTSKSLNAVHSPVRGVHPNLEEGIKTFVKYVGGENAEGVAEELEKKGIETKCFDKAETTEAGKLLSTTQYGLYIMISKKIKKYCDDNDLDYEKVYKHFNKTYNEGYSDLNMEKVLRPIFDYEEGKIGGHCVIPNTELIDWSLADWLKAANDNLE